MQKSMSRRAKDSIFSQKMSFFALNMLFFANRVAYVGLGTTAGNAFLDQADNLLLVPFG
jgi:hypothetical protein